jgi:YVTN family beta-propeller protein
VGREPSAVLADPASGRTFVLNEGDSTISVLEGTTVVATWPVPEQSTKLAIVDGQLWVGSRRGGRITVLSAKDGMALGEVKLSATGMVFQLLASADARRIYAVSYARIHMIDVATRQEVASAVLNGAGVLALPASGPGLYATGYDSATQQEYLALLDTETLSEKAQLPSVPDLAALAADPRNGRLYLISSYTNELVVLDGQSHQRLARLIVGRTPRSLALDAEKGTLYVANYDGDNVAIVDTAKLAVVATVPLALRLEGMDVDPVTGRLYVAAGSANTVYLLGEAGVLEKWPISGYPSQVRVVPGRSQVACLSLVEDKLTLLDQMGKPAEVYTTGHRPRGLMIDDMQRRIYAGDTVLEWEARITHTLRISTPAGSMESPVQMLLDTRRNRLYAVALNGIPGSNNGYVVTRIGEADADPAAPAPGKLSVVDLVYDEEMDRFYATNARMGTYGLQVSQGEDGRELLALRLDRYPAAMALNPATRHLWVVLQSVAGQATARDTQIAAYDTRTLGRVALLQVDGFVESLSVDPRNNRIYLANGDAGLIHVVQDVPMSAPAGPIPYSTPKP